MTQVGQREERTAPSLPRLPLLSLVSRESFCFGSHGWRALQRISWMGATYSCTVTKKMCQNHRFGVFWNRKQRFLELMATCFDFPDIDGQQSPRYSSPACKCISCSLYQQKLFLPLLPKKTESTHELGLEYIVTHSFSTVSGRLSAERSPLYWRCLWFSTGRTHSQIAQKLFHFCTDSHQRHSHAPCKPRAWTSATLTETKTATVLPKLINEIAAVTGIKMHNSNKKIKQKFIRYSAK